MKTCLYPPHEEKQQGKASWQQITSRKDYTHATSILKKLRARRYRERETLCGLIIGAFTSNFTLESFGLGIIMKEKP